MSTGVVAALVAPAAGVLLYGWLHERPRLTRGVDNGVYVVFPVLVAWYVLPDAWRDRDPAPVLALVAGALVVGGVARLFRAGSPRAGDLAVLAATLGAAGHSLLDGAALAAVGEAEGRSAGPLLLAVGLHRVFVGAMAWWLIRPRHGPVLVWAAVCVWCAAATAGYMLAPQVLAAKPQGAGLSLHQAFVAGTLLHVVFHQGRRDHAHDAGSPPGAGRG